MTPTVLYSLVLAACSPVQDERPRPTSVPASAPEVEEDVFYLGTQIDPQTGEDIQGYAFVDRAMDEDAIAEMSQATPNAKKPCYVVLGYGAWTSTEPWGLDTTNSSGLSGTDVQTTFETGQGLWETASAGSIFGDYTSTYSGEADTTADGENNVQFGDAGGGGIVAVTYVWGKYWGGVSTRYINEWDEIYEDDLDWTIGDPVGAGAFDLLDVAAHELGHAAGLAHPPNTCPNETMYAYVSPGETKKRSLNSGDVTGISTLY